MEILREGTANKINVFDVKCEYCETEVRIPFDDMEAELFRTGAGFMKVHWKCPVCGEIQVDGDDYSHRVTKAITLTKEEMKKHNEEYKNDFKRGSKEHVKFLAKKGFTKEEIVELFRCSNLDNGCFEGVF